MTTDSSPQGSFRGSRRRRPSPAHYWHRRRKALRAGGIRYPSLAQLPAPWRVVRLAARCAAQYNPKNWHTYLIIAWFEWLLSRPKAILQQSASVRFIAEAVSVAAIVVALVAFILDLEKRDEDRVNQAWQLIAAAKMEGAGNVGLIDSLETLNRRNVNLAYIRLPGAYLQGVNLRRGQLTRADLRRADLSMANLTKANLSEANLTRATLIRSQLTDADLLGTSFQHAYLSMADLTRANLQGADLTSTSFLQTDLTGASLRRANLKDASLRSAKLTKANLTAANLTGAYLGGAHLKGADLTETNLTDARDTSSEQIEAAGCLCNTRFPDGTTSYRDCPRSVTVSRKGKHFAPLGK